MTGEESEKRIDQYSTNSRVEVALLAFGVWGISDNMTLRESYEATKGRVYDGRQVRNRD